MDVTGIGAKVIRLKNTRDQLRDPRPVKDLRDPHHRVPLLSSHYATRKDRSGYISYELNTLHTETQTAKVNKQKVFRCVEERNPVLKQRRECDHHEREIPYSGMFLAGCKFSLISRKTTP